MEPSSDECWTRCLNHVTIFTLNDINLHRLPNGKDKNTAISKTLETGRKFKSEDYLCTDSSLFKCTKNTFTIKAKCSASMKKTKRDVVVTLTRKTSREEKIKCNWTVGASSYCNCMMTLLFGIADYSVKGLTLKAPIPQNGQTQSNTLNSDELFENVWPFCKVGA